MQAEEIKEVVAELEHTIEKGTQVEEQEILILLKIIEAMASNLKRSEFDSLVSQALTEAEQEGLYDPDYDSGYSNTSE